MSWLALIGGVVVVLAALLLSGPGFLLGDQSTSRSTPAVPSGSPPSSTSTSRQPTADRTTGPSPAATVQSAAPGRRTSADSRPSVDPESGLRWVDLVALPPQVAQTVRLIEQGGPFPYERDGITFGNRERLLPARPSGWYREYTVVTPGEDDRGPRRVVTGDNDRIFYYTADHYASFVRIRR